MHISRLPAPERSLDASRERRPVPVPLSEERGTVLVYVAAALGSLLLFMVLAFDAGRVYLGRTQLQIAADNAARAALSTAYDDPELSALEARDEGVRAGLELLPFNSVIDGGATAGGTLFTWGRYNFQTGVFEEDPGDPDDFSPRPAAVRVRLDRSRGSEGAFDGLSGPIGVQVESIATLRCRDVAIALDLSSSFAEELGSAQEGLRRVANSLMDGGTGGDRLALVTFNGADTVHGEPASLTALGDADDTAPLGSNSGALVDTINQLQVCPPPPCPLCLPPDPDCLGTNTASGINAAFEQLESSDPTCPGDRLIVLVTDGVPCAGTATGASSGGFSNADYENAATQAAMNLPGDVSLSTIFLSDTGGQGCPNSTVDGQQFSEDLVRGDLGQAFTTSQPDNLGQLLATSIGSVPVVMVD